jgi:hypothetical protein
MLIFNIAQIVQHRVCVFVCVFVCVDRVGGYKMNANAEINFSVAVVCESFFLNPFCCIIIEARVAKGERLVTRVHFLLQSVPFVVD